MAETYYQDYYVLTDKQKKVMQFIVGWVRSRKTPVPHHEVVIAMTSDGMVEPTVVDILKHLIKYGYIRRSNVVSNKTFYVQIRSI